MIVLLLPFYLNFCTNEDQKKRVYDFASQLGKEVTRTHSLHVHIGIGVREGILLGGRKKFALKITICPKNKHLP